MAGVSRASNGSAQFHRVWLFFVAGRKGSVSLEKAWTPALLSLAVQSVSSAAARQEAIGPSGRGEERRRVWWPTVLLSSATQGAPVRGSSNVHPVVTAIARTSTSLSTAPYQNAAGIVLTERA